MKKKLDIVAHNIGWKVVDNNGETLPNASFFSTRADARIWVQGYRAGLAVVTPERNEQ